MHWTSTGFVPMDLDDDVLNCIWVVFNSYLTCI